MARLFCVLYLNQFDFNTPDAAFHADMDAGAAVAVMRVGAALMFKGWSADVGKKTALTIDIDVGVPWNDEFDGADTDSYRRIALCRSEVTGKIPLRVADATYQIDVSHAAVPESVYQQLADFAFNIQ